MSSEILTRINQLSGVPLMIFANKQDLAGAKESGEIAALLGLASIKDRSWQIQGCPSGCRPRIQLNLDCIHNVEFYVELL